MMAQLAQLFFSLDADDLYYYFLIEVLTIRPGGWVLANPPPLAVKQIGYEETHCSYHAKTSDSRSVS